MIGEVNTSQIIEEHSIPNRKPLVTAEDPAFQDGNDINLMAETPSLRRQRSAETAALGTSDSSQFRVQEVIERRCWKIRRLGSLGTPEAIGRLNAHLVKYFPLCNAPRIRPIVLETLDALPVVPDDILQKIAVDEELFSECAIGVRQQIWVNRADLFVAAISPVVESYLDAKARIINDVAMTPTNFFTCDSVKSRRQNPQITELLRITGRHSKLFRLFSAYVQKKFALSGNAHYCSLRLEFTMAAKDLNIEHIVRADFVQDFACCLDACLRDQRMDIQQSNRLKSIMERRKKAPAHVVAEMAMVAADSHVIHLISSIAVKALRDLAGNLEQLPREHESLTYLVRVLRLGLYAREIVARKLPMPGFAVEVTTKFLPSFVELVADDIVRMELSEAPAEMKEEHRAELNSPVSDAVKECIENNRIAAILWLHYTWNLFPIRNRIRLDMFALLRYIDLFPNLCDKLTYRGPWVHLIAHRLLVSSNLNDIIGHDTFIKRFFGSYLLPGVGGEACVKYQILRLCNVLHLHMGQILTNAVMEQISPERMVPHISSSSEFEIYESEFRRIHAKIFPLLVEEQCSFNLTPPPPQPFMGFPQSPVLATSPVSEA